MEVTDTYNLLRRSCVAVPLKAVFSAPKPHGAQPLPTEFLGSGSFLEGLEFSVVPILRLGLKNKGTEKEPRAPVPWASSLRGLKLPKNEKQRKDTVEGRGSILGRSPGLRVSKE